MRSRALSVAAALTLLGAGALPAMATHDPIQTLPVFGGASQAFVGLADDGVATAVWGDTGAVKASTRPADGFFGAPQTLAPAHVSDIRFDEAPNGNAVIAYTGNLNEGELIAHYRSGSSGKFGPGQVLVADGAGAIFGLDLAVSDAGHAVAVWQDISDPLNPTIQAAVTNASGDFGAAATVHQAPGLQDPKVDVDAAGNALATWDFASAQATNEIQIATAPAGGAFGTMDTLEQLEQGPGQPDVAVNANGAAVIVWEDFTSITQCPSQGTCSRDILEAAYGNVSGVFGPSQMITDPGIPTATGDQEAAIDDSGKAALLYSAVVDSTSGVFAAVSDAAGTFTMGANALSPFGGVSGDVGERELDISAGAGEFTAVWSNDHDQDGAVDETWRASTSSGVFEAPHQISPDDDDSTFSVHGDRNALGQSVATWVLYTDRNAPQVTPVAEGTPPAFGSESDDDLTGTDEDDVMHLLGGNDLYSGGDGNDSIYGDGGNDKLSGEGGSDLVDGGPGSDTANGGGGDDSLLGRGGGDELKGGTGDDTLKGGGGNDVLDGGGFGSATRASGASLTHGGELIIGGAGKDTCFKYSKQDVLKSCEIVKKKRAH